IVAAPRVIREEDGDHLLREAREDEHVVGQAGDVRRDPEPRDVVECHPPASTAGLTPQEAFTRKGLGKISLLASLRLRRVSTSHPVLVTTMVCSNWAESDRSEVRTVHLSAWISTSKPPRLIIGSIVKTMPARIRSPLPRSPTWETC